MARQPTGIWGLDMVLGGGLALVEHEDAKPSTAIVIRGAPGSGKTILGTQLAANLAASWQADVLYCCVEVLPSEIGQQAGQFDWSNRIRFVKAPFSDPGDAASPRVFASILNLGTEEKEDEELGRAVSAFLEEVKGLGGKPRVLVLDSLSDGYRLGSKVRREVADGLCKFGKSRGLTTILLEETSDNKPSLWAFVADVVLQFEGQAPGAMYRSLTVPKNRFGPSDPGPHEYSIIKSGMSILPRYQTFRKKWAEDLIAPLLHGLAHPLSWTFEIGTDTKSISSGMEPLQGVIVAVHGPEVQYNIQIARSLGRVGPQISAANDSAAVDVWLQIGSSRPEDAIYAGRGPAWVTSLSGPTASAAECVTKVIHHIKERREVVDLPIRRLVIGDLQAVRSCSDPDELLRGIHALATLFRAFDLPVILFETTAGHHTVTNIFSSGREVSQAPAPEPRCVDFADVSIEVIPTGKNPALLAVDRVRGKRGNI
jgi:KaiC/GvpD/RAD55 family RecA-like ATPase